MINNFEYDKLLHDLKRVSLVVGIIRRQTRKDCKDALFGLLEAEINRIYKDIEEFAGDRTTDKEGNEHSK